MIESGSSIQTFLTCQKLFDFKYNKLLEPRGYSSALGFGTFLHAEVERILGGRDMASVQEFERVLAAKEPGFHDQIRNDFDLATKVSPLWLDFWNKSHIYNQGDLEWLLVEEEWGFPVGDDIHVGKSDGVVRDKNGAVFLYELKSASSRDREGYVHKLEIDRQVSSNILALKHRGVEVAGALYDIFWKPALIRKRDRKTMPDETLAEFSLRQLAAIQENPSDHFERQIIYRSDRMLKEHEKDLSLQFAAMRDAASRGYARNTGACHNYNSLCPFFSACVEGREELQSLYSVKDRKLPELSKEIQGERPTS